ncbi:hypothetical protein OC861_000269 [Tilletia horrida]|nr:hypothetical protein OC861_000269 [Tilletia horrida]
MSKSTALFFIDIQENMLSTPDSWWVPERIQPQFLANAKAVLERARELGLPIYHVQHASTNPDDIDAEGKPGWQLHFPPGSGERVLGKTVKNVFESNPGLGAELRERGIKRVLTCGLQSEMCVRAASLAALQEDGIEEVVLLHGAHATMEDPDDGKKAEEISADVEKELEQAGVKVVPFDAEWGVAAFIMSSIPKLKRKSNEDPNAPSDTTQPRDHLEVMGGKVASKFADPCAHAAKASMACLESHSYDRQKRLQEGVGPAKTEGPS